MREEYGAYIKKYDSPLSSYMHSKLNEGALMAEDEATNGMGEWAGRFGRRVLREDDRGFVYCHHFSTVDFAEEYMAEMHGEWETEEEAEVVEGGVWSYEHSL